MSCAQLLSFGQWGSMKDSCSDMVNFSFQFGHSGAEWDELRDKHLSQGNGLDITVAEGRGMGLKQDKQQKWRGEDWVRKIFRK